LQTFSRSIFDKHTKVFQAQEYAKLNIFLRFATEKIARKPGIQSKGHNHKEYNENLFDSVTKNEIVQNSTVYCDFIIYFRTTGKRLNSKETGLLYKPVSVT